MTLPINIFFTGDFAPINQAATYVKNSDFKSLFGDIVPLIKSADISVVNLELPLTDSEKVIDIGTVLKGDKKCAKALKYAGFNLASLANNHINDCGAEGIIQTKDALLQQNIQFVGAGKNIKEAREIRYIKAQGKTIAFISISENSTGQVYKDKYGFAPINIADNFRDIKEAKSNADYVIILVHGGHEFFEYPSPRMKDTYRFFAEAGATAIIGHHTHCYSGHEVYNGVPIFYSLGNFIFDSPNRIPSWYVGIGVTLTIKEDDVSFNITPFTQYKNGESLTIHNDAEKQEFLNMADNIAQVICDNQLLESKFERLVQKEKKQYLSLLEPTTNRYITALTNRGFIKPFVRGKKKRQLFHTLNNESAREIILELLRTIK